MCIRDRVADADIQLVAKGTQLIRLDRTARRFHLSQHAQARQLDFVVPVSYTHLGAQSVLVSHNVVNCMDADRPASLSAEVHRILREELGFDGVILTDDLIMDAIRDYTGGENAAVLAVQAGNDMLLSLIHISFHPPQAVR